MPNSAGMCVNSVLTKKLFCRQLQQWCFWWLPRQNLVIASLHFWCKTLTA